MKSLFLLDDKFKFEIMEEAFKLPPEQRHAFIVKKMKEGKAEYLGETDKTAPELAIEANQAGVAAISYSMPEQKVEPKAGTN